MSRLGRRQSGLERASPLVLALLAVVLVGADFRPSWPLAGRLSSDFGERNGRPHVGLDVAAVGGTLVGAVASGRVVRAGLAGDYGLLVELDHGDGWKSRYAHLGRLDVEAGDLVARGDVLGVVGATGNATGPHLHFEVRLDGRPVDPIPMLQ